MAVKLLMLLVTCLSANALHMPGLDDDVIDVIGDILRRVGELEERDRLQQTEIKTLRAENAELQDRDVLQSNRIAVLEDRERTMAATIDSLVEQFVVNGRPDVETYGRYDGDLTNRTSIALDELDEVDGGDTNEHVERKRKAAFSPSRIGIRQADTEMIIAFFASLTDHMQHMGVHQAIEFDNIITNTGQAYHADTGMFTAPITGTYVLSTSILSWQTTTAYEFSVNGHAVTRMNVHAGVGEHDTTSQTAVLHLYKGDNVSIRNDYADIMTHGHHYSTFAGFLLAPTDAVSQIVG